MTETADSGKGQLCDVGKSIVLIGMPGAGKSTIGPVLATKLGIPFKDTDIIVKEKDGRELRDIVQEDGFKTFLYIQQKVIMSQKLGDCIIATGGSVVKSSALMKYFKELGKVVYLKWDIHTLEKRLGPERRLARADGQTFRQVFQERESLYIKYADSIIDCKQKNPDDIADEIVMQYLK